MKNRRFQKRGILIEVRMNESSRWSTVLLHFSNTLLSTSKKKTEWPVRNSEAERIPFLVDRLAGNGGFVRRPVENLRTFTEQTWTLIVCGVLPFLEYRTPERVVSALRYSLHRHRRKPRRARSVATCIYDFAGLANSTKAIGLACGTRPVVK